MSASCMGYESSGDDSQGQAQDCQDYQPLHDLAHEPWRSWDV